VKREKVQRSRKKDEGDVCGRVFDMKAAVGPMERCLSLCESAGLMEGRARAQQASHERPPKNTRAVVLFTLDLGLVKSRFSF
jgi:hypothetical protein